MQESRSVYIGGIPFDYTEEQVMEIAQSVGPVSDLKLLFDPVTGKSKGYAFVRYGDHETAASAVRNLNFMAIGSRHLRCSYSSDAQMFPEVTTTDKLPSLPLGIQVFNQDPELVVSQTLASLDRDTAVKIVKEAKQMSLENPALMKKLLDQCPQLSQALVEASLLIQATTKDLVQFCVNRQQQALNELTYDHVELLRSVNKLGDKDLSGLDEDKVRVIKDIQEEISKGSYGIIQ